MKRLYRIVISGLTAVLALSVSAPAMAEENVPQCQLSLRVQPNLTWRGPYGRGYEVFDGAAPIEPLWLSVQHEGAPCRFALTAMSQAPGGEPLLTGPGASLRFDVTRELNGASFISPDYFGNDASQLTGAFGEGSSAQAFDIFATIPPGQVLPGGSYSGGIIVRLFELRDDGPSFVDERPLAIFAPVMTALDVEMNGNPGARQANVNLGYLTDGADRSVGFLVRSNANVSVELVSANGGKLAHQAGAAGIAYEVVVNGQTVDLSAPATAHVRWDGATGFRDVALDVHVPAVPRNTAAGRYSDTITVTFTAEG